MSDAGGEATQGDDPVVLDGPSGWRRTNQFETMLLEQPAKLVEGKRFVDWWIAESPARRFFDSGLIAFCILGDDVT